MKNVQTINSAARTTLVFAMAGAIGYGGYFGYENYIKPGIHAKQAIADLEALESKYEEQEVALQQSKVALNQSKVALQKTQLDLEKSEEQNQRLETSLKLMKVDKRIANVTVLEKGEDENGQPYMQVSFVEVNEENREIGSPKIYKILGEKLYIDGWIVSFEDKYVENADELRNASLYVFKSIYGDDEKPKFGQRLDGDSGNFQPPGIYSSSVKGDFEQQIWKDFWDVSNDRNRQMELGIRASHGLAGYVRPEEGKTYRVHIRSSGGMTLQPIDEP
ncbi:MAG: hypothetical protein AAF939_20535 [Planctomycetota bacterium]